MYTNKSGRQYFGVLRRLAKLDYSNFTKFKVTVCEGEFNEEKEHFFIAPLIFFDSEKDLDGQKMSQISTGKTVENSTEQSEISNGNKNGSLEDYPDSSDFSDDE